ncbi:MAG: hypothetical protein ISS26_08265 [Candidatus Omnitrophica bacterium]|nr:hypothetical protein [Candidatus Omnitrophota bacterium]
MLWIQFIICVAFIIASGYKMTIYADDISKKTGLSSGIMGLLVLAFITSCPELVTTLSSISVVDAPDLAIGDLIGANAFNIFAIAVLGVLCGKGSIMKGQGRLNIFTISVVIIMLVVVMASIRFAGSGFDILNMSFGSILIGVLYSGALVFMYKSESHKAVQLKKSGLTAGLMLKFIAAASIIIASGVWLARIGKNISTTYEFSEMYVGVLLIAFATTMPEFVVSLTALKKNSISMATGNLIGSNMFNIFIITILDVVLRRGSFFKYVSALNVHVSLFAIVLTAIALGAMLRKGKTVKILKFFTWDSLMIITAFIVGHTLIFNLVCGGTPLP